MSRERLSPQQRARLELELRKGPLAHGFAGDQGTDPGKPLRFSQRLSVDHLVLKLHEDECGFDDVADRGRTDWPPYNLTMESEPAPVVLHRIPDANSQTEVSSVHGRQSPVTAERTSIRQQ